MQGGNVFGVVGLPSDLVCHDLTVLSPFSLILYLWRLALGLAAYFLPVPDGVGFVNPIVYEVHNPWVYLGMPYN